MKRLSVLATLALGFVLGISTFAAAQNEVLRVNVPFDFVVAGWSLPAGHYIMKHDTLNGSAFLTIEGENARRVTVNDASLEPVTGDPRLTFNRYGDRYFLSDVITGNSSYHFARTKEEVRIARMQKSEPATVSGGR